MGTPGLSPNPGPARTVPAQARIWGQSPNPRCTSVPARIQGRGDLGIWGQSPNPGPAGNSSGRARIRGRGDSARVPESRPRVPEAKGGRDSGTVPKSPNPQIPESRGRRDGTPGFGDSVIWRQLALDSEDLGTVRGESPQIRAAEDGGTWGRGFEDSGIRRRGACSGALMFYSRKGLISDEM